MSVVYGFGGFMSPLPKSNTNLTFQCNIKTPSGLKTGTANPYTITAAENIGGGFITAPPVGTAVNPETVYLK